MRTQRRNGFTLVEILIVVVILGILAAIVVPQFTNASQEAIKGALASQLQTVNAQVELYRVQNAGDLPHTDADAVGGTNHNGWGVLVENDYLKDEPNNTFTGSTSVAAGTSVPAYSAGGTNGGWAYDTASGEVVAIGYNHDSNLLGNETGYTDPTF